MTKWFYSHEGQTHGPFTIEEIKPLAAKGLLREHDWIWPEGSESKNGTLAQAALDFPSLFKETPVLPDWLEDVARLESKGPVPPPLPTKEIPDWLEDLRLWYGVEPLTNPIPPAALPFPEVTTITAPIPSPDPSSPLPIANPVMPSVAEPGAIPVAIPLPEALSSSSAPSTAPVKPVLSRPGKLSPSLSAAPGAASISTPMPGKETEGMGSVADKDLPRGLKATTGLGTEKAIKETGFDPRTGKILDPAKFQKWKLQKAESTAAGTSQTNASVMEVFRKARMAIENWVDDDGHRGLILGGDLEEIKNLPEVVGIFEAFANYGPVMQEKLQKHFTFMVENRRNYYSARGN